MMYYKIINDRTVFSTCKTIRLEQDHDPLVAGQVVSNPSAALLEAEGWQIYIPPVVPPQPQTDPDLASVMQAVKKMLSTETEELSDEDALDVAALFPTWASKVGKSVNAGERLWWDGRLWKTTQYISELLANWTPDTAVSLFVEVSIEEWPPIPENIPSTAPWMAGDKGTWQGQHYICKINNTVHNPSQYPAAWELIP